MDLAGGVMGGGTMQDEHAAGSDLLRERVAHMTSPTPGKRLDSKAGGLPPSLFAALALPLPLPLLLLLLLLLPLLVP